MTKHSLKVLARKFARLHAHLLHSTNIDLAARVDTIRVAARIPKVDVITVHFKDANSLRCMVDDLAHKVSKLPDRHFDTRVVNPVTVACASLAKVSAVLAAKAALASDANAIHLMANDARRADRADRAAS